jgi:hypothetical protein
MKGLKPEPGWPPGLGDVVELVLVEVEAAHHGVDRAVARVQGDEGALHLGDLRDLPAVLGRLHHADDGAAAGS